MPRSIWKGSLSFGLVNVPVGLYPATTDKTLHFHQVEDDTSDRIRYKKVNALAQDSTTTSPGALSDRKPRQAGCRRRPA